MPSMLSKVILLYKNNKLQQRWISEVKQKLPHFSQDVEDVNKRKKWRDFRKWYSPYGNGFRRKQLPFDPFSPRRQRWVLGFVMCGRAIANALNTPPGDYGRKIKTQRNWR